jgi:hypothetical protein
MFRFIFSAPPIMPPKAPNQAEQPPAGPSNRSFQFQKRRQLFIRTHNETLSVATMRALIGKLQTC